MMVYELMIKTNKYLISGGKLNENQKKNIVTQFIGAVSSKDATSRFYRYVRFPGNVDAIGRRMYPIFYIPPSGRKLKTLLTQTPKTHILSANMYELEILRLLAVLAPGNRTVASMLDETKDRLKTTCFGYEDDGVGECFDTSLVVLRFLASAFPEELDWIKSRIDVFHSHFGEKRRIWCIKWYYWLCLSEIPEILALPEIMLFRDELLSQITRSAVMNSDNDKDTHPMLFHVVRNCLSRLPEYSYIKEREPYVNPQDGRLHFNIA